MDFQDNHIISTIEDPKEAIKKTPYSVLYVSNVKTPIVIVEKLQWRILIVLKFLFI